MSRVKAILALSQKDKEENCWLLLITASQGDPRLVCLSKRKGKGGATLRLKQEGTGAGETQPWKHVSVNS